MVTMFNDGILEATLYSNRWVFCRWVKNQRGRLQKTLIRDLNMIEREILNSKLAGWFTDSELTHRDFHRLLVKFGAMPREISAGFQRFVKPILKESDLHVRK